MNTKFDPVHLLIPSNTPAKCEEDLVLKIAAGHTDRQRFLALKVDVLVSEATCMLRVVTCSPCPDNADWP